MCEREREREIDKGKGEGLDSLDRERDGAREKASAKERGLGKLKETED